MNAVPFDTLRMARRLEEAGFPGPQAAGASEALAEALVGADLATKGDMAALQIAVKADVTALRAELKGDIAALRAEVKTDTGALGAQIELLRRHMTIRLGGMLVVGIGVMATILRLFPHP